VKRTREPLLQSSTADASTIEVRRININTASADELEALPGIGRAIAQRIVTHRSQHGPFRRVEHVMLVRGISEQKFLDIQRLITVH
jgi:competence protein ComEA